MSDLTPNDTPRETENDERTENEADFAELEEVAPGANILPGDFVPIYDSPDYETGEVICATLVSAGIPAVMQNPTLGPGANTLPALGNTWSHAVYVAPENVEAARAILSAPAPTEDELAAEEEADSTSLEQAERNVRNA